MTVPVASAGFSLLMLGVRAIWIHGSSIVSWDFPTEYLLLPAAFALVIPTAMRHPIISGSPLKRALWAAAPFALVSIRTAIHAASASKAAYSLGIAAGCLGVAVFAAWREQRAEDTDDL